MNCKDEYDNCYKDHKDPCDQLCCEPCENRCCDCCDSCCDLTKSKIKCTPAYKLYFKENIDYSDCSEVTQAFNINDGDFPCSVISADFTGIQNSVYDLKILPLGHDKYHFKGLIKPYLIVTYKDGADITRKKFLSIDIAINHTAHIDDPVKDIDVYSILKTGAVYDLSYDSVHNTISLKYELKTKLYAIKNEPEKFAVIDKYDSCKCPMPHKHSVLKVNTVCHGDTSVLSSAAAVPFHAKGREPYTLSEFKFLPVKSNLLAVTQNGANMALNLSFPVQFTLHSSDGVESKQESALFVTLIMNDYDYDADSQFLLSLAAELIGQPVVSGNVIRASVSIKGIVSNVNPDVYKVKVVDFVDCGSIAFCNCDISGAITTTR